MRTQLKVMPSLQRKIDGLKQLAEQQIERKLVDIAQTAVDLSPVDTGAYVTSFSFSTGAGRPRGKSSKGKPRTNPQAARSEGLQPKQWNVRMGMGLGMWLEPLDDGR